MRVIDTYLNGIKVLELDCHPDDRGYFMEIYNANSFKQLGIDFNVVQDNCSFSLKRGVIRGLHFQKEPYAQAKLIRCTKGSFYDLAVDLRKGSPSFGKAMAYLLKENDQKLVFIPRGFAHGVAILEDNSEYTYKVDHVYNGEPVHNGGLSYAYDSSQLNWDLLMPNTSFILSTRDIEGVSPSLAECDTNFVYDKEGDQ